MSKVRVVYFIFALSLTSFLHSFSVSESKSYVKNIEKPSSFKKIYAAAGPIDIHLTQGNTTKVTLEGEQEDVEKLSVHISQGELQITSDQKKNKKNGTAGTVKINITTKNLANITTRGLVNISSDKNWKVSTLTFLASGSGLIEMPVTAKNLIVQISGSGQVKLTGTAVWQDVAVTGSGKYEGLDVKSQDSIVVVSGSGSAEVFAKDSLTVTIYGSGDIHYKGTPAIKSNVYGSGRLVKSDLL